MDAIDILKKFGLSDYESKVLLTLIRGGELTAREISDQSGVPRTSVYETVDSLRKRGFIELSFSKPQRFRALPVKNIVENLKEKAEENLNRLSELFESVEKKSRERKEEIWVIQGELTMKRLLSLIESARKNIKMGVNRIPEEVLEKLSDVSDRVEIEVISNPESAGLLKPVEERGGKVRVLKPGKPMRFEAIHGVIIVDDSTSMTFFFRSGSESLGIISSGTLVQFYSYFLQNLMKKG